MVSVRLEWPRLCIQVRVRVMMGRVASPGLHEHMSAVPYDDVQLAHRQLRALSAVSRYGAPFGEVCG